MPPSRRPHPLEAAIEAALCPGEFIDYEFSSSFISNVEGVRARIDALIEVGKSTDAVGLYEAFIAGCYAKADDVDDSDGEFGMFVGSLVEGWIKARQAAGADADATVALLVAWIRTDDYGFMSGDEHTFVGVLDRHGRAALERLLVAELATPAPPASGDAAVVRKAAYWVRQMRELLKAVYVHSGQVDPFVRLCEADGIRPADCEVVAGLLGKRRRPEEALAWVDRGLALEVDGSHHASSFALPKMRREFLRKLGRGEEAIDAAWAEYEAMPSASGYETLLKEVPKHDAARWRVKALGLAEARQLGAFIEIATKTKEWDRLAGRVLLVSQAELQSQSHYTNEPAAQGLAKKHPAAAARLFEALGMRIVVAKKSAYYVAALQNFVHARRCYEVAGETGRWAEVVATVRREHSRKRGFMPGFEEIVAGDGVRERPSFLGGAVARWQAKTRGTGG